MLYRREHPEFTVERVFSGMCEGVAEPGASEDAQVDALLTAFGSRLEIFNGLEADQLMRLISALFRAPLPHLKEAAIRNESFWRGMFSVMVRAHQGKQVGFKEKTTKKATILLVLHVLACVGLDLRTEDSNALSYTCLRAGIFDALDEAVEDIVEFNGPASPNDYCRAYTFDFMNRN